MTISDVFVRRKLRWNSLMNLRSGKEPVKKSKCPECDSQLDYDELTNNRFICPKCGSTIILHVAIILVVLVYAKLIT